MNITYYGHSCFGVEVNGKHLVFDPFIRPNTLAKNIDFQAIKADYIIVSHGHVDHTADLIELATLTGAQVIASYELITWINKKGISNTHAMNTGGKWKFDFGHVKCVNAVHSSSLPDGTYGGSAMGFIIESTAGHFYYAGDTALTYDMKLIGEYRNVSFAFLPIGDNFTMSVDNAIIASEFIRCPKIIGMHYNTFNEININTEEAVKKFKRAGKELILMEIGSTLTV